MHIENIVVLLVIIATGVALIARQLKVPYTVALVAAGLMLGPLHLLEPPHLTQELLFSLFLPGLLFEAAFHLEFNAFRRNTGAILSFALPGVAAAIALTAAIMMASGTGLHLTDELTWGQAAVFGALVAATDPMAVVGLFRSLGVPARLGVLIEGESLFNDGTSIVFFTVILGAVSGTALSGSAVALEFIRVVGLGAIVGLLTGLAMSYLTKQIDDAMIEITLTTIAAYGSFILAEQVHGSGVIATVVAGMLCGNYGARVGMSPTTRIAVASFWEYLAFLLNSIVFLLIGFEVRIGDLADSWRIILAAFAAVVVGRAIVVSGVVGLLSRTKERIPPKWAPVLAWGGLRGGLSMVLALSLPADFPNRALLVTATFGVVILSILVQGLTMGPLLRRLGLASGAAGRLGYEVARGQVEAAHAALTALQSRGKGRPVSREVQEKLREEYEQRVQDAEASIAELPLDQAELRQEENLRTRRRLLMVERTEIDEAQRHGELGLEAAQKLLADVDSRLLSLDAGHGPAEGDEG